MNRRVLFIVNPIAGAGQAAARWRALRPRLSTDHLGCDQVVTDFAGHACTLARERAARYDVVVAVGGDGTASEVATGLLLGRASRTALAIVPLGTGNDAAQLTGVRTAAAALTVLAQGAERRADVIEVTSQRQGKPTTRCALVFAAVGFAGEVLERTTSKVKRLWGQRFAYWIGLCRALLTFESPRLRVTCDGQTAGGRWLMAYAGNCERSGGGVMRVSPGASCDDGLMNVNLISAVGRLEILRQLARLTKGTHIHHPAVRYLPARTLSLHSNLPVSVQADGDVIG